MERIANTLLPARMFVLCSFVCCENGFVGSSDYETSNQAEGDVSAKAKSKYYPYGGSYCAELEALCNEVLTEWNNAGDKV